MELLLLLGLKGLELARNKGLESRSQRRKEDGVGLVYLDETGRLLGGAGGRLERSNPLGFAIGAASL